MKKNIFFLLTLILTFSACKKTEVQPASKIFSNYEGLIGGKWFLASVKVSPALNGDTDLYASYPNCVKDDTIYYKKDSVFTLNSGTLKCQTSEPQESNYMWYIQGDSTIYLNGGTSLITKLDDKVLETRTYQVMGNVKYTYKHSYLNVK